MPGPRPTTSIQLLGLFLNGCLLVLEPRQYRTPDASAADANASDTGEAGPACTSDHPVLCGATCVDTATDPAHCGGCNIRCPGGPNATPACRAGQCALECNPGFENPNGMPGDGCEAMVSLGTPTPYATSAGPSAVTIADFDGDGLQDVAVACSSANAVMVLWNSGGGTLSTPTSVRTDAAPHALAAGRLRSTSAQTDLVTAYASTITVLLAQPGRTLVPHSTSHVAASSLALGRIDAEDDALDLVASDSAEGVATVHRGNNVGSFTSASNATAGAGAGAVALLDWNGDRLTDVAVANERANNVSILTNTGMAMLRAGATLPVGLRPVAIVAEDFDRDRRPDLATANADDDTVSVLVNTGTSWVSRTAFVVGSRPVALAAGDVDRDGLVDLVVANRDSNDVMVFRGDGRGGFTRIATLSTGIAPAGLALGDLNGNGTLDLVVANQGSSNVSVFVR
jgi:hypothetical protein